MASKESVYSRDWFDKARRDIGRVENLLRAGDDLEDAGFHLQQAVEKYLKGYLLSKGWKLERTHDLVDLLNSAVKHEPFFEQFRTVFQQVTEYYIEERYPSLVYSRLTKEEIREGLGKAKELASKILQGFQ